jgi:hypothetical protein
MASFAGRIPDLIDVHRAEIRANRQWIQRKNHRRYELQAIRHLFAVHLKKKESSDSSARRRDRCTKHRFLFVGKTGRLSRADESRPNRATRPALPFASFRRIPIAKIYFYFSLLKIFVALSGRRQPSFSLSGSCSCWRLRLALPPQLDLRRQWRPTQCSHEITIPPYFGADSRRVILSRVQPSCPKSAWMPTDGHDRNKH